LQNIQNDYLLFIILLIIVTFIGYIIYNLYEQNNKLKKTLNKLKIQYNEIENSNIELNSKNNSLENELQELKPLKDIEREYYHLKGEYGSIKREFLELKESLNSANRELEELKITKSQNEQLQKSLENKEQFIKSIEEQLSVKFTTLADKIFEDKQSGFLKNSSSHIKHLLEPFNSELNNFKAQVEKINQTQNSSISMLRGELIQIKELNLTLSKEANALTNALKNDSKVQGNWGELILEKALESSGLKEGVEYKKEQTFKADNGKLRADIVIYLPENKHIVIDAKVSLKSYTEILQAKSKEEEQTAKKRHIISLKRKVHI